MTKTPTTIADAAAPQDGAFWRKLEKLDSDISVGSDGLPPDEELPPRLHRREKLRTVPLTVRLPEHIAEALRDVADDSMMSMSAVVYRALRHDPDIVAELEERTSLLHPDPTAHD